MVARSLFCWFSLPKIRSWIHNWDPLFLRDVANHTCPKLFGKAMIDVEYGIENNTWLNVNNDVLDTSEVFHQWCWRIIQVWVKIIGESPHELPKTRYWRQAIYHFISYKQRKALTHWGRVTHTCVSDPTSIGSDNDLSPGRRQAIIWTNAGILLIRPLGRNFSENSIEFLTFSFTKSESVVCEMAAILSRSQRVKHGFAAYSMTSI